MFTNCAAVIAVLFFAAEAQAFWRLPCSAPVIVERADPIVSPGAVSGHVHTISGASNVGLSSTFESMRASDCTSCLVQQDLSAYWTPQLYMEWANGSFTSVNQVGGGLIYYLPRYNYVNETVNAFPDGLRMLIGNPTLRSYNSSSLMAQAIGWNCLGASGTTRNPYLPNVNCPNGLRGELRFPSCWNGVDTDSSDHFSHMAYPLENESGPCPTTHPVRIVTLFYEMMWDVNTHYTNGDTASALNPSQPFVLAMGDNTGYGYHADFLDGWDKAVLQEAINTCTDPSGVIELCTVFDLYDDNHTCAKTPDVDEIVLGTVASLPGCNLVPGPSTASQCNKPAPAIFSHPVAYTGGAPPPGSEVLPNQPSVVESYGSWKYDDCYSDLVNNVRALPNGITVKNQTVESCLNGCAAAGYSICGIEYHGECWGGNTLGTYSTVIGYGECSLACNNNPLQYCGGSAAMDIYRFTSSASSTSSATSASTTKTGGRNPASPSTSTSASAVATTVSTSSTSTSSASTSSTTGGRKPVAASTSTSSTSTSAPSSTKLAGKVYTNSRWTYSTCMSDNVNSYRSLPNTLSSNGTVDGCLAACDAVGSSTCGLSYYGECYGGAGISRNSTVLPAASCTYPCSSNAAETCGGSNALDVYLSTVVPAPITPTAGNLASAAGWSFAGCWADQVNGQRSLPTSVRFNNTIEGCLAGCTARGATVCALSYGGECWETTTTLSSSSYLLPQAQCGMPCKGNSLEWCGGSAALSLYLPTKSKRERRSSLRLAGNY